LCRVTLPGAGASRSLGPALVERVLRTGETVTLRGRKIWLELVAAGNVDVSVDGKGRPIPTGTTNVVVGQLGGLGETPLSRRNALAPMLRPQSHP
jgi:hypothetical protein